MALPNRYIELKQEEVADLAPYGTFKVKHVKGKQVLIAHGTRLFCVMSLWDTDFKRGETVSVRDNLLVPNDQPLFV